MQPHKPACEHCHDTGSLSKTLWGDLDCTSCEAPADRMRIRRFVEDRNDFFNEESLAWHCYRLGVQSQQTKLQAMAVHLRRMWGWALQIGEQFNPASDTERADWRKQCDEAMALLREYPPQQQSKLEE